MTQQQRRTSFINFRPEPQAVAMAWEDICRESTWQGRWVALDDCAYTDEGEATAGLVVDHDENLADLCARLLDRFHLAQNRHQLSGPVGGVLGRRISIDRFASRTR